MRHRVAVAATASLAILLSVAGISGGAPTAPAKERQVIIKSQDGEGTWEQVNDTYIITHAVIQLPDSNATMSADRIEFNNQERWVRATGHPRLWDDQSDLKADLFKVDLRARRADAEGTVRLVARPKPGKNTDERSLRQKVKEPVVVLCDTMQYYYREKKGTATGNLKFTQKDAKADRSGTAKRLSWDGNTETLVAEGDVQVTNTRGEAFECPRATIIVKEGAEGFRMTGPITATFFVQEEDEEEKKPTPPPANTGTPAEPAPAEGESANP